jgi:hypothetical protein
MKLNKNSIFISNDDERKKSILERGSGKGLVLTDKKINRFSSEVKPIFFSSDILWYLNETRLESL